jgi:hypothetical protein
MKKKKKSKVDADYGPGRPTGDHCGVCRHFQHPHMCDAVEGIVRTMGWCKYFERRR